MITRIMSDSRITSAGDSAVADDVSPALPLDSVPDVGSATVVSVAASAATSAAPAADASARRKCAVCRQRISAMTVDKHSLCSTCRGGHCSYGNKCNECLLWPDADFDLYLKVRSVLDSKSKARKDKRRLAKTSNIPVSDSESIVSVASSK